MYGEKGVPSESLIEIHSLVIIFWGMKEDQHNGYICAAHTAEAHRSHVEQISDLMTTEHKISAKDCLESMLLLLYHILGYYCDQLILKPNCENLAMSKDDTKVVFLRREH